MITPKQLLCVAGLGVLTNWLSGCSSVAPTTPFFRPVSSHAQYGQSLKSARLDRTALGLDWIAAGERALRDSLKITIPYRESGYFSATKPFAVGYRLSAQRGDRFRVQAETQGLKDVRVFIDVFELDGRNRPTPVAASQADTNALTFEPHRTRTYLIRVQPELLRSGHYVISVTRESVLRFPVQGRDSRQISSFFGAPRDGGRRRHEGVDIFAPRGTPVLASVNGTVSNIGTGGLGGNSVSLTDDERNLRIYYAHLDRWNVRTGQRVAVGDTLGYVGTTGNARTTGPHLHFGVYGVRDGATDPLPFIRAGSAPARQPLLSASRLGDSMRVATGRAVLRLAPNGDAPVLRQLPRQSALVVTGGTADWYRVELPDGLSGYVAADLVEPTNRPIRRLTVAAPANLLDAAHRQAAVVRTLPAGSAVDVLAQAGSFQLVKTKAGQLGWLTQTALP